MSIGKTLACGVSVHDLNALLDYREGATDALAPRHAQRLDTHVGDCPYCRQTLDSLSSLHSSALTLLDEEASANAEGPWLDKILSSLSLEAHPGRYVPLAAPRDHRVLDQTEGSLRALVRTEVGDENTLVVRTTLDGDLETYGAGVHVGMTVHVRLGSSIPTVVDSVRRATYATITKATPLRVEQVDITVADTFGDHRGVSR